MRVRLYVCASHVARHVYLNQLHGKRPEGARIENYAYNQLMHSVCFFKELRKRMRKAAVQRSVAVSWLLRFVGESLWESYHVDMCEPMAAYTWQIF